MKCFLFTLVLMLSACTGKIYITDSEIRPDILYKTNRYKPYSGKCHVVFSRSAVVKDEFTYKNGLLHGETTSWHKNGRMRRRGYYHQGLMTGKWELWDENGNKTTEANFEDDMLNGLFILFYSDGRVKEKGSYVRNIRKGEWITAPVASIDNLRETVN
jgi:antitoxin component YwqK of YwqJK toxin-antitoxin module